jgi:hypothetical protein
MSSRILPALVPVFAFLPSLASAADAPLSIRTLAPEKSFLVVGIDDLAATRTRLEASPLGKWWASPAVQEATAEWRKNLETGIEKETQELGVPRETVCWPASGGLAMASELDEDTGMETAVLVMFLDWGADAEKFATFFDASMAKQEKEKTAGLAVEEIKGRRTWVFETGGPEAAGAADPDAMDFEEPASPFEFPKFYVSRDGGRLFMASSEAALEDAFAVVDGGRTKGVGETADFKDSLELVGGDPDAFATLLTKPLQPLVAATGGFEFALIQPFIGRLFGDIRGWSFSVDLNEEPGGVLLSQHVGILVPDGKVGLLSLLGEGGMEKVPAIVPADAIGYGRMNVKFSELMKVLNDVVANLPEMQAEQIQPMLEQFEPMLSPSFAAMGPGMDTWTVVKQPITPESMQSTTAIPVGDAKAAQGLMAFFGPQAGLAPRDFLGNTVYSGEMADFAVGYGQTHMFLGSTDNVEAALRAVGQADAPAGLDGEAKYRDAMAKLAKDGLVGYGWVDTVRTLEVQEVMLDGMLEGGMGGLGLPGLDGLDPDEIAGLATDIDPTEGFPELSKLLKAENFKEFFGPAIWQMRSVPKGFRLDSLTLPAAK